METTHSFVERLQKMSNEEKKDIHVTIKLLSELQEIVYQEDNFSSLHELVETIDEIDSGIAEVVGLYIKRLLEFSEINIWERWEPLSEKEQALMDENIQMQRGEFICQRKEI